MRSVLFTLLGHFIPIRKRPRRVGRGIGSGRGKTSTRGHKGQKARSSNLGGFEGGQIPMFRELPKKGFRRRPSFAYLPKYAAVSILALQNAVDSGALDAGSLVDLDLCLRLRLVPSNSKKVKIVGNQGLYASLSFKVYAMSKGARKAAESTGSSVESVV